MSHRRLNLILLLTAMLFVPLSRSASFAQGMCDAKSFRLNNINGKVVSNGPKGYEPIAQAKVELWRIGNEDEEDEIIASTSSEESGLFQISNIKDGRYRIEVSKWESGFIRYYAVVRIAKRAKAIEKERLLVFRLGVEVVKPCGGGDVFLL